MLLNKDNASFILIDVQEKLTPLVLEADSLIKRCEWLLRLVGALAVPVIVSEQYPQGLGKTVKALQALTGHAPLIEKLHFSCYRDPNFVTHCLGLARTQVVLAGIETHVCVLQTAMDMVEAGFEVFVVVDAVSARHALDHRYGLKRMKQAGVQLVSAEMVFFEWVGQAGTPEFKALSQAFFG